MNLRELRLSKGISLAALAKASGYTASHVCGAENGDHCSEFAMQAMFDAIPIADKYPKARIEVAIRNLPAGNFTTRQLALKLDFPTTRIMAQLMEMGIIERVNRVTYKKCSHKELKNDTHAHADKINGFGRGREVCRLAL